MGLIVLPALIPDVAKVYDAYFAAFAGELIIDILFPAGVDETFRQAHTAGTVDWWHKTTMQHTFKCLDTETGEIVGMATWEVYWRERSEEERRTAVDWLQGKEKERAERMLFPIWEKKEKLCGARSHVYCQVVAVHPAHQKRGVGALLMEWGVGAAERLGVPVYLESTPKGVGFYQKLGFEKLKEGVLHKREAIGSESDIEVPLMAKMPAAARMTFEEWAGNGLPQIDRE